ncbi:MAG: hypothetical protein H7330_07820 [Hymenobacteraceae bacterium]|nr:hypothetical protein [Hymenobacteraceae bacterium]
MKLLLFLLLALPLLASSCRKDANPPPTCTTVTDVPPAFLAYWYFPQGSWWVYQLKDAVPAIYDTVRVAGAGRMYRQPYEAYGAPACVWGYGARLEHSNRTYFPGAPLVAGGPPQRGVEGLSSFSGLDFGRWGMSQSGDAGFSPPEACFVYPFTVGGRGASNWYLTADTAQITTPAGTFARTVHTAFDTTQIPAIQTSSFIRHFWRTRNVGLTKIAFATYPSTARLSGTTWELVNYHLVR